MKTNLTLYELQNSVFNKALISYGVWSQIPDIDNYDEYESLDKKEQIEITRYDVIKDSCRMLTINYLMALLGSGKNDKISFYNNYKNEQDKQIANQKLGSIKEEIDRLKTARDKIYSHFDPDFMYTVKDMSREDFEKLFTVAEHLLRRGVK